MSSVEQMRIAKEIKVNAVIATQSVNKAIALLEPSDTWEHILMERLGNAKYQLEYIMDSLFDL